MSGDWQHWGNADYADLMYRRAIGDLPEMESSRAAARRIKALWETGDSILDAGCGAGHYLRSLRRELGHGFAYQGIDIRPDFLTLARQAHQADRYASFVAADIFSLPYEASSFDIVTCNNLLENFPSLLQPLSELVRVARKAVIIRFLCGDRTYLIRDVHPGTPELDDAGEPLSFNYYNIYSQGHVEQVLRRNDAVGSYSLDPDREFSAQRINQDSTLGHEDDKGPKATKVIGTYQVNGYILLPWTFLTILKK